MGIVRPLLILIFYTFCILQNILRWVGLIETPIAILCENGNYSKLQRRLRDTRVDVNKCDENGTLPLIAALYGDHFDCFCALLGHCSVDPNIRDFSGRPAISAAIQNRQIDFVEALLAHPKITVNLQDRLHLWTPLHYACKKNLTKIVQSLLTRKEIDPNREDLHNKWTPLHMAQQSDCPETTLLMLADPRVDPNKRDRFGMTPLHWACQRGKNEIVLALLKHPQIDPSITDEDNKTILFSACTLFQSKEVIQTLLEHEKYDVTWEEANFVLSYRKEWGSRLPQAEIAYWICLIGNYSPDSFFREDDPFLHEICQKARETKGKSARNAKK